jgi:hypothetical protein
VRIQRTADKRGSASGFPSGGDLLLERLCSRHMVIGVPLSRNFSSAARQIYTIVNGKFRECTGLFV